MKTLLVLAGCCVLLAGCARDDSERVVRQDPYGNYATTSDYNAMEREEFKAAMEAGYRDFEAQLENLRLQANQIGQDAIEEFHDHMDGIAETRTRFEAELARLDSTLERDWPERREEVAELYLELRDKLTDAYDDVIDET